MPRVRFPRLAALALAALVVVVPPALADERVAVTATSPGEPTPLVTANGVPSGTLRLEYTHVGMQFPAGLFATIDLDFTLVAAGGNQPTSYPTQLALRQTGSANLALLASPAILVVDADSWSDRATVDISIPADVATNPDMNADGTELVANLQLESGHRSRLQTPTSVQVKVRLVHPTSCVKQYTFISDRENENVLASIALKYGTRGGNTNKIMTPVQTNQNVLLVNVCAEDVLVDLRVGVDSRFVFGPGGSGKAIFIYSTAGQLVPGPIDVSSLTEGPVLGKVTDIPSLPIPGGTSVLIKLHLKLNPELDRFGVGTSPFSFSSSTYEPGGYAFLHVSTDPNPAATDVPVTLTPQN